VEKVTAELEGYMPQNMIVIFGWEFCGCVEREDILVGYLGTLYRLVQERFAVSQEILSQRLKSS
jgi:hypothetical protein